MSLEETATTLGISSLASYADSDEEIGNTPEQEAVKDLDKPDEARANDDKIDQFPDGEQITENEAALETVVNKSNTDAPNSEIGDAYADTENVEGSNAGGDYNMLPSEFDSDDEKQYSDEDSDKRKEDTGAEKRKGTSLKSAQEGGLVSYAEAGDGDEIEDEDEYNRRGERGSDSNDDDANGEQDKGSPSVTEASVELEDYPEEDVPDWLKKADLSAPNAFAALLHKVKPKREDLVLPPMPRKRCSKELELKYEKHHLAMKRGKDFIKVVESSTTYRNPSIYEKLVEHLHINEKGTNFPKSVFNPRGFPRSAYYDELARIQNELHAKKQQHAKNSPQTQSMATSNAVITTIAPAANTADKSSSQFLTAKEEPLSRKSKWDIPPAANTSAASTGTLIPASGPLKKPKLDI